MDLAIEKVNKLAKMIHGKEEQKLLSQIGKEILKLRKEKDNLIKCLNSL